MNKKILYVLSLALIWGVGLKAQTITAYEYWFNSDYANRTLVDLNGSTIATVSDAISTSDLAQGHHTFWFHTQSSDGKWSIPVSSPFVKGNNPIVGLEYWFDNDYSNKIYYELTPSAGGNYPLGLPVSNLSIEDHIISICFVDQENIRSIPVSGSFYYDGSVGLTPDLFGDVPTVFPNPGQDHIRINGIHQYNRILIFNSFGQLMMNTSNNQLSQEIAIEHLSSGMYTIHLLNEEKSITLPLLKK